MLIIALVAISNIKNYAEILVRIYNDYFILSLICMSMKTDIHCADKSLIPVASFVRLSAQEATKS